MSPEEEKIIQVETRIEAFLRNKMSDQERISFTKEMADDPDLLSMVEFAKELDRYGEEKKEKENFTELFNKAWDQANVDWDNFEKESKEQKTQIITLIKSPYFWIAVAALALIWGIVFPLQTPPKINSGHFVNRQLDSLGLQINDQRTSSGEESEIVDLAKRAFKNIKYKDSVSLILGISQVDSIIQIDTNRVFWNQVFYPKTLALFQLGQTDSTIKELKIGFERRGFNPENHDHMQWLLVLAYHEANQIYELKKLLEEIIKSEDHTYYDEAKDLFGDIEN